MDFIYNILLSDVFLIGMLLVIFIAMSRWALGSQKAYGGYALGWLVALFVMVVIASLRGTAAPPEPPETNPRLSIFQVLLATGFGFGGGFIMFALSRAGIGTQSRLARHFKVAAYTIILLFAIFLMLVTDGDFRRMVALTMLAFTIVSLTSRIIRRPGPDAPDDDESTQDLYNYPRTQAMQERIQGRRTSVYNNFNRKN